MHTLQEALDDIAHVLGSTIHPWQRKSLESAHEVLRTALIQQEADNPFQPDWVNYRQGFENGKAEALEQVDAHEAAITAGRAALANAEIPATRCVPIKESK